MTKKILTADLIQSIEVFKKNYLKVAKVNKEGLSKNCNLDFEVELKNLQRSLKDSLETNEEPINLFKKYIKDKTTYYKNAIHLNHEYTNLMKNLYEQLDYFFCNYVKGREI